MGSRTTITVALVALLAAATGCMGEATKGNAGDDLGTTSPETSLDGGSMLPDGAEDTAVVEDTAATEVAPDPGGPPDIAPDTPDEAASDVPPDVPPDIPPPPDDDLGAFCGMTEQCRPGAPGWPNCIHAQCDTDRCLFAFTAGAFPVCGRTCALLQDADGDGIEDDGSSSTECAGAEGGPAGDSYRCVDFGDGQEALPMCAPGSFATCASDADCAPDEGCFVVGVQGQFGGRCVARKQAGAWGGVHQLGEICRINPVAGPVYYCATGFCTSIGCTSMCVTGADCDTTQLSSEYGCDQAVGTCLGWPEKSCTEDLDCSFLECDPTVEYADGAFVGGACRPRECVDEIACADGSTCTSWWNGETTLETSDYVTGCVPTDPDGAALGEECAQGGAYCENPGFCVAGHCSGLCLSEEDCAADQICRSIDQPIDFDEDEQPDDYKLLSLCVTYEFQGGPCQVDADCDFTDVCSVYATPNLTGDGALDPDAPAKFAGTCLPENPNKLDYGTPCPEGSNSCKSGICISQSYCSTPCTAQEQCEPMTFGDASYPTYCGSALLSLGDSVLDPGTNVWSGVCRLAPVGSTLADCSADLTCAGGETCYPLAIDFGPTSVTQVSYRCLDLTSGQMAALGDACTPSSGQLECASGICLPDPDGPFGYCSQLCSEDADCSAVAGLVCQPRPAITKAGAYAANQTLIDLCSLP